MNILPRRRGRYDCVTTLIFAKNIVNKFLKCFVNTLSKKTTENKNPCPSLSIFIYLFEVWFVYNRCGLKKNQTSRFDEIKRFLFLFLTTSIMHMCFYTDIFFTLNIYTLNIYTFKGDRICIKNRLTNIIFIYECRVCKNYLKL